MIEGARDMWFEDDYRWPRWIGWSLGAIVSLLLWLALLLGWNAAFAQTPVPNVVGSQYLGTPLAVTDKQLVPLRVDNDGTLHTTGAVSGTVAATQSGTWTVQPGNTPNTTPWLTTPVAGTTGGATPYFLQPTASDNHATIKNGAGTAYGIMATNNSATINYLRLYNLGSGFNGCNSATGLLTQVAILGSGGLTVAFPVGMAFSTGLSICVTSGYATTDTTNATASAMSITVFYN